MAKRKNAIKKTKKHTGTIVPNSFKVLYAKFDDTCGDKLAIAIKKLTTTKNKDGRDCLDVAKLSAIASANGLKMSDYAHLNNGQKRMCIGNKLRGMLEQDKVVVVEG